MNESFMRLYRESIHYKAERERNPEASDIVLLGYCHASDDFYSPEASDAYAIFKQMESEKEALQDAYKPWMFLFAILGAVLAYVSDKI